jgi:hypothetical protein
MNVALLQTSYAVSEVGGGITSVSVHSSDICASRFAQADVQSVWRPARGVGQQPDAGVAASCSRSDFDRHIRRSAIDDEKLGVSNSLLLHVRDGVFETTLLVQHRRQH